MCLIEFESFTGKSSECRIDYHFDAFPNGQLDLSLRFVTAGLLQL